MASVKAVTFSGNNNIDGMFYEHMNGTGSAWLPGLMWDATSLTYSFPADHNDWDNDSAFNGSSGYNSYTWMTAPSAVHQADYVDALDMISKIIPMSFSQVTETSTVHGDLSLFDSNLSGAGGRAELPAGPGGFTDSGHPGTADGVAGTVYMSPYVAALNADYTHQLGTVEHLIMTHETLHTFGLYDVSNTNNTSNDAYNQSQGWVLPYRMDNSVQYEAYTIMSYRANQGQAITPTAGYGLIADGNYAETPMMYDIQAMQWLYGAGVSNAGDTVYSWNPSNGALTVNGVTGDQTFLGKIYRTVYDSSGIDTYDFSNYTTNLTVDLRPGAWTTVSTAQLADLSLTVYDATHNPSPQSANTYVAPGNIANALPDPHNPSSTADLIENVMLGTGTNTVTGNDVANIITGNSGSDTVDGLGGGDTFVEGFARSAYTYDGSYNGTGWTGMIKSGVTDWTKNVEAIKFTDGIYSTSHVAAGDTTGNADVTDFSAVHGTATSIASKVFVDGAYATKYDVWDDSSTGAYFKYSGVKLNDHVDNYFTDLSALQVVTGSGADSNLFIRSMDVSGAWGAWGAFTATGTGNTTPTGVANSTPMSVNGNDVKDYSDLFTFSDADGDSIGTYYFWSGGTHLDAYDGHGHKLAEGSYATLTPQQYADAFVVFDNTSNTSTVYASANDGYAGTTDTLQTFNATAISTTGNHAAVSSGSNVSLGHGVDVAFGSLFSITDADSDAIKLVEVWDDGNTLGGHIRTTASEVLATGAAGGGNVFTKAQFDTLTFGDNAGADTVYIRAFDGKAWGSWSSGVTVTNASNSTPVASGSNFSITHDTSVAISTKFSVTDADSDTITMYQFWDGQSAAGSGHFDINGVNQTAGAAIQVLAADLATVSYEAGLGAGTETLSVRAFDGTQWGAWHDFAATTT